jgi:hypothetical protein
MWWMTQRAPVHYTVADAASVIVVADAVSVIYGGPTTSGRLATMRTMSATLTSPMRRSIPGASV